MKLIKELMDETKTTEKLNFEKIDKDTIVIDKGDKDNVVLTATNAFPKNKRAMIKYYKHEGFTVASLVKLNKDEVQSMVNHFSLK